MAVAVLGESVQAFDDAGIPFKLTGVLKDKRPGSTLFIVLSTLAECKQAMEELQLFLPAAKALILSGLELLPLDPEFASSRLVTERIRSLHAFYGETKYDIILTTPDVLYERLPGPEEIARAQIRVEKGMSLDDIEAMLADIRYESSSHLSNDGCYARRNKSILDLWPSGEDHGIRLVAGQDGLSAYRLALDTRRRGETEPFPLAICHRLHIRLQPDSISAFRKRYRDLIDDAIQSPLYTATSKGEVHELLPMCAPLMYVDDRILLDQCDLAGVVFSSSALMMTKDYPNRIQRRFRQIRQLKASQIKYFPPIEALYWTSELALSAIHALPEETERPNMVVRPRLVHHFDLDGMLSDLRALYSETRKFIIAYQTEGRRDSIEMLLAMLEWEYASANSFQEAEASPEKVVLLKGSLSRSLLDKTSGIVVLSEMALFGFAVADKDSDSSYSASRDLYSLRYLSEGDPLVHREHGVGRFNGVAHLALGDGSSQDYLSMKYADGGTTYIKMIDLDLVSRYGGTDPERAPLHRVNEPAWQKAVKDANRSIFDTAASILRMKSTKRIASYSIEEPDFSYQRFASEFPFQETRDQQLAIDAVINDLSSGYLMDRLVCGDVGFGKTEVAMRAAFLVAQTGGIVMMLAPTTVLAEQHYRSFRRRFNSFPQIKIGLATGDNKAESRQAIAGAALGKIHILIGTHRLLQTDVPTANIGLIIIDEEQRFGVQQKENADLLRSNVHILSTTATPIPRTLSSAMAGLREISVIATPPAKRLSVRTTVSPWTDAILLTAIDREIQREGQVFLVAPTISVLEEDILPHLTALRPHLRFGLAHGKMDGADLTEAMRRFYEREIDVLLCTTVIESGIDVPNANTMLIYQAENFGLSQLHQLRGRVGRSDRQAYAYLMTVTRNVPESASLRLNAFAASKSLGEGYLLAQQDLEIRGAGEILGESQSGHIHEVGYSLYMEMLQHTLKMLLKNRGSTEGNSVNTHLDVSVPGRLRAEWIADPGERVFAYKRLLAADSNTTLNGIWQELVDVFGEASAEERKLFVTMQLRLAAESAGLERLVERQGQWRFYARLGDNTAMATLERVASETGHEYKDGIMTLEDASEDAIGELLVRLRLG